MKRPARLLLAAAVLAAASLLAVATASAVVPTVTIENATSVEYTTAQVRGKVDTQNEPTTWRFQYVDQAGFEATGFANAQTGPEGSLVANSGFQTVEGQLTGLQVSTEYHLRLLATNADGASEAIAASTFKTKAAAKPLIDKTYVSGVSSDEATLNAEVNPGGAATEYHFQYLTEAQYEANPPAERFNGAAETPSQPLSGKADPDDLAQAALTGLAPDTTYRFRVLAANEKGAAEGAAAWLHTYPAGEEPQSCPNEARRTEQHAEYLPDCRAYEMVSPPDKNGGDVMIESSMTRAAEAESPGLPAAVSFASLVAFGDARGTGVSTEYLAQRDAAPGTQGWSTHGIAPAQQPMSFGGDAVGLQPGYDGDLSPDLTAGVFRSWSPLTEEPNVAAVENLYRRDDLRSPGPGSYALLSDASSFQPGPTLDGTVPIKPPFLAAATPDAQHVLFETLANLTPDAVGENDKLYKTDGEAVRLLAAFPTCPGSETPGAPCSAAGLGARGQKYLLRVLSADGSRAIFTDPVTAGGVIQLEHGFASRLFQLDDRGTPSHADDATIQLNASEKATPGVAQPARYGTASADGSRVFFFSGEQLTEKPGGGLYMWARQGENEIQQLAVDATGGAFTLTFHSQLSTGSGVLSSGSTAVGSLAGSFVAGQAVSGTGIPAGTTIASTSLSGLTLSAPATASGAQTLHLSTDATTAPLPFDATAAEVQAALEGLAGIGQGNVAVSGGPGGPGAGTPYEIEFTGALSGVDVAQPSAGAGALSGGASTAVVQTTTPVRNLTLLASIVSASSPFAGAGTIGASADGHRLYFSAAFPQLVPGAPPVAAAGIYSWQDASGPPGGTLSYVGQDHSGDLDADDDPQWNSAPKVSRVSPDGRVLLFETSFGEGLAPANLPSPYDQLSCHARGVGNPNNASNGGCSEAYLYRAESSTPTEPDLLCATCNPSGALPLESAYLNVRENAGAGNLSTHLSHALSADGRYVFFSSRDALLPRDTNGTFDAYEFDAQTGRLHLLTSGTAPDPSYFLDASADGHDVYVITRQRLLGWDVDNAYDVYDVRQGGGFPEPPPPPPICEAGGCRHAVPPAPPAPPVGSGGEGPGNPPPPRPRCPKGRRAVKSHGHTRCVKPHHRKHHGHRRANANRGGRP